MGVLHQLHYKLTTKAVVLEASNEAGNTLLPQKASPAIWYTQAAHLLYNGPAGWTGTVYLDDTLFVLAFHHQQGDRLLYWILWTGFSQCNPLHCHSHQLCH